jgi:hypothetical protein
MTGIRAFLYKSAPVLLTLVILLHAESRGCGA